MTHSSRYLASWAGQSSALSNSTKSQKSSANMESSLSTHHQGVFKEHAASVFLIYQGSKQTLTIDRNISRR
ncbi:predicted protein [Botrytis cinerea T4]|uniref:Uncharacterized protein n=1 Tax=Botryotinia fuckeliana (strain T4) TaxID=999810 RepID=G2Y931_BOTF4|nr:predicted protein [Botrytis cinerea T4]